jgi:hypothetical protein
VIYDFCESRVSMRAFPEDWKNALVCDDFAGYKAVIYAGRD